MFIFNLSASKVSSPSYFLPLIYKVGVALISNFFDELSLCFKIPSSIDLFPTQTLISSFFKPPSLAIFKRDLKGSWVLVQSFCLLYKTFKKLKKTSAIDAQTGPAIRNDKETIDKHINHLSESDFLNLYKLITKNIMSNEL